MEESKAVAADGVADGALAPLLERPVREGLYLALGPGELVPWALDVFARVLHGAAPKVVWIDAGNGFDAFRLARASRTLGRNPREALAKVELARPFNAFQLTAMLEEKLLPAFRAAGACLAVLSDPLALCYDPEMTEEDAKMAREPLLKALGRAAAKVPLLCLAVERRAQAGREGYLNGLLSMAKTLAQLTPADGTLPARPEYRLLPAYRRFSRAPDLTRLMPRAMGRRWAYDRA